MNESPSAISVPFSERPLHVKFSECASLRTPLKFSWETQESSLPNLYEVHELDHDPSEATSIFHKYTKLIFFFDNFHRL